MGKTRRQQRRAKQGGIRQGERAGGEAGGEDCDGRSRSVGAQGNSSGHQGVDGVSTSVAPADRVWNGVGGRVGGRKAGSTGWVGGRPEQPEAGAERRRAEE
jgi:hypothetical protein